MKWVVVHDWFGPKGGRGEGEGGDLKEEEEREAKGEDEDEVVEDIVSCSFYYVNIGIPISKKLKKNINTKKIERAIYS